MGLLNSAKPNKPSYADRRESDRQAYAKQRDRRNETAARVERHVREAIADIKRAQEKAKAPGYTKDSAKNLTETRERMARTKATIEYSKRAREARPIC